MTSIYKAPLNASHSPASCCTEPLHKRIDRTTESPPSNHPPRSRASRSHYPSDETRTNYPNSEASATEPTRRSQGHKTTMKEQARESTNESLEQISPENKSNIQVHSVENTFKGVCSSCKKPQSGVSQGSADDFDADIGSITLLGVSAIQFRGFSDDFSKRIGQEIAKVSLKGISKGRRWGLGYEIKFKRHSRCHQKQRYDILTREMLLVMRREGYDLRIPAQDITYTGIHFFVKSEGLPKTSDHLMSISFRCRNILSLLGASAGFEMAVKNLLQEKGAFRGEGKRTSYRGSEELNFKTRCAWRYWWEKKESVAKGRLFMMDMMRLLKKHRWRIYAALERHPVKRRGPAGQMWHCIRD